MVPLIGILPEGRRERIRSYIRNNPVASLAKAVIIIVLVIFGMLFAVNWDSTPKPAAPKQTEAEKMAIYNKVREAMLPTNDVFIPEEPELNYKRAKVNMDKLAASDTKVAESRYFAINMFELCVGLDDKPCMEKQAKKVKSLSSDKDPYTADTTKRIADKMAQYGN